MNTKIACSSNSLRRIATLAVAVICLAAAAFAQEKRTVAVYVTGSCNNDIKEAVRSRIVAQIMRSREYAVIARTLEFDQALRRVQGTRDADNVNDGQVIKLGKQFGADLICVADASEMLSPDWILYADDQQVYEYIFTARLINVETGLIIAVSSVPVVRCENKEGDCGKYYNNYRDNIVYTHYHDVRYDDSRINQEAVATITDNLTTALLQNVTTTADKQKLAVYVTRSSGAFERKSASSRLIQNFINSGAYTVIDRTSDFQKEIDGQYAGKVNDTLLTTLGRRFGVNLVCTVDVIDSDYADVHMIDAETGIIVAATYAKSWRMDAIDATAIGLMTQLGRLRCVGKDKPGFMDCCEGLKNVNGICRDTSGAAYWVDKSTCGVEVWAPYYRHSTWKNASSVCPEGWRLPKVKEMGCLVSSARLREPGIWITDSQNEDEKELDKGWKLVTTNAVYLVVEENSMYESDSPLHKREYRLPHYKVREEMWFDPPGGWVRCVKN
jgi:hypothetical protein